MREKLEMVVLKCFSWNTFLQKDTRGTGGSLGFQSRVWCRVWSEYPHTCSTCLQRAACLIPHQPAAVSQSVHRHGLWGRKHLTAAFRHQWFNFNCLNRYTSTDSFTAFISYSLNNVNWECIYFKRVHSTWHLNLKCLVCYTSTDISFTLFIIS